jgi:UDP-N-acetylglucosamine 2-epimerase
MCAAAAAAFHNKVPIAHFYAGIVNDPITTYDDVDRHCITLWSDIQFCEDDLSALTVKMLKSAYAIAVDPYVVGISHLDDLELDESNMPKEPYDLILLNHEPIGKFSLNPIIDPSVLSAESNRQRFQIRGNPDGAIPIYGTILNNLPRPRFLGLLKNCERFITNSSAAIYEAPHFLKSEQIVMVGDRNKNRPRGPFQTGASDRIVEILKEYLK